MEKDNSFNAIEMLVEYIKTEKDLQKLAKPGLCRLWTASALTLIKQMMPIAKVEAREIDLDSSIQHTFIRLSINDQPTFLLDGTGVEKHPPYFGLENEAPSHLQNSHPDILNSYLTNS